MEHDEDDYHYHQAAASGPPIADRVSPTWHPSLYAADVMDALADDRLEEAVRVAFAQVETRLRELTGLTAVAPLGLIYRAFGSCGPLCDRTASALARLERRQRFLRAFARHHGEDASSVPADLVQALAGVLVADMLLHELDAAAAGRHRR